MLFIMLRYLLLTYDASRLMACICRCACHGTCHGICHGLPYGTCPDICHGACHVMCHGMPWHMPLHAMALAMACNGIRLGRPWHVPWQMRRHPMACLRHPTAYAEAWVWASLTRHHGYRYVSEWFVISRRHVFSQAEREEQLFEQMARSASMPAKRALFT